METRQKRKSTDAKLNLSDDNDLETDGCVYKKRGRYSPRKHEVSAWGPRVGHFPAPVDEEEAVYELLKRTGPRTTWRRHMTHAMTACRTERSVRNCLDFFQSCVGSSLKVARDYGFASIVPVDHESAPSCLSCEDWTGVLSGLTLDTTQLGIKPQISRVDISIGKTTDTAVLTGFLFLLQALHALTWSNLDGVRMLTEEQGSLVYENVSVLSAGYGIDPVNRRALEIFGVQAPDLIMSLGFSRTSAGKLQWEQPGEELQAEFQNLVLSLHGLFRPTEVLKSIV